MCRIPLLILSIDCELTFVFVVPAPEFTALEAMVLECRDLLDAHVLTFSQCRGRTGRMGRRGRGVVLVGKEDRKDVVREVREGMYRGASLL